jgi:hypothetical protein
VDGDGCVAEESTNQRITVTIKPVESTADLRRFIDFQYDHYRGNRFFVPPLRIDVKHVLNERRNPFFEHGKVQAFLAEDGDGRVVGRIAGIVNGMHLRKYDDGVGFFGFFEAVEDAEVSAALISAAGQWLREQGLVAMRGPTNPSMNDVAGLLVDGFDRRPAIMMPYNKPYYQEHLVANGFERAMTMWAYFVHAKYANFGKLFRGRDLVLKRQPDLTVRTIDMDRFEDEARLILDVYNDAWSQNWGHVPMTKNEFSKIAKDMKQVLDPDLVIIVENSEGPIGFAISLPDMNLVLHRIPDGRLMPTGLFKLLAHSKLRSVHAIRTLLMGVRLKYQGRGLDAVLVACCIENGMANGFDEGELSWVLDTNHRMINHLEAIGAVKDKEYAMYEKRL